MIKFPEEFYWGASFSGPQTEGNCNKVNENVWDTWYKQEPDRFYNQYSCSIACDTYNRYQEDVSLMKNLSLNSIRTSIQWTRLIKDFETGEVDPDGYQFYKNYFKLMKKNNIEPFINLYHFDMPDILMKKYGGFESKHVVELFVLYAKKCFELFSEDVNYWITMNEPIVPIEFGYFYDAHRPNKVDPKLAIEAGYNTLLAHSKVVDLFKKNKYGGEIGIVLNLTPTYSRSDNKEDLKAAFDCDAIFNKSFLDPIVTNKFNDRFSQMCIENNLIPNKSTIEDDIILNTDVDFLGINYYVPRRVKARMTQVNETIWFPDWYFEHYDLPGSRNNPHRDGNEIYPKAVYDIAIDIKENYGNIKWYLAEIGISMTNEDNLIVDNMVEDSFRTELLKEHLVYLHKAINEGCNCFGLHQWTFIDNWSWLNSHKRRYGLYYLDLNTRDRRVKRHGLWFKKLIEDNGF